MVKIIFVIIKKYISKKEYLICQNYLINKFKQEYIGLLNTHRNDKTIANRMKTSYKQIGE